MSPRSPDRPGRAANAAMASWAASTWAVTLEGMDYSSDVLLLRAVQAWCDVCEAERILVPASDDVAEGLCCTGCDSAAFGDLMDPPGFAGLRRPA